LIIHTPSQLTTFIHLQHRSQCLTSSLFKFRIYLKMLLNVAPPFMIDVFPYSNDRCHRIPLRVLYCSGNRGVIVDLL